MLLVEELAAAVVEPAAVAAAVLADTAQVRLQMWKRQAGRLISQ